MSANRTADRMNRMSPDRGNTLACVATTCSFRSESAATWVTLIIALLGLSGLTMAFGGPSRKVIPIVANAAQEVP